MSECEQVTFQTAIEIWECILKHINSGVPVEGLKHQVETHTNRGN
jgi:hypothetical protein